MDGMESEWDAWREGVRVRDWDWDWDLGSLSAC